MLRVAVAGEAVKSVVKTAIELAVRLTATATLSSGAMAIAEPLVWTVLAAPGGASEPVSVDASVGDASEPASLVEGASFVDGASLEGAESPFGAVPSA